MKRIRNKRNVIKSSLSICSNTCLNWTKSKTIFTLVDTQVIKVLTFARRLKDNGGNGSAGKEKSESHLSATNCLAASTTTMINTGPKNTDRKVGQKKITKKKVTLKKVAQKIVILLKIQNMHRLRNYPIQATLL